MANKLYLVGLGSKIYTTHMNPYRTCVVGMTSRMAAYNLAKHIETTPIYIASREFDKIPLVKEIDYMDDKFYKMLKLNNFALLIADEFVASDTEIVLNGNVIDVEYQIDDEHRMYFERLLGLK